MVTKALLLFVLLTGYGLSGITFRADARSQYVFLQWDTWPGQPGDEFFLQRCDLNGIDCHDLRKYRHPVPSDFSATSVTPAALTLRAAVNPDEAAKVALFDWDTRPRTDRNLYRLRQGKEVAASAIAGPAGIPGWAGFKSSGFRATRTLSGISLSFRLDPGRPFLFEISLHNECSGLPDVSRRAAVPDKEGNYGIQLSESRHSYVAVTALALDGFRQPVSVCTAILDERPVPAPEAINHVLEKTGSHHQMTFRWRMPESFAKPAGFRIVHEPLSCAGEKNVKGEVYTTDVPAGTAELRLPARYACPSRIRIKALGKNGSESAFSAPVFFPALPPPVHPPEWAGFRELNQLLHLRFVSAPGSDCRFIVLRGSSPDSLARIGESGSGTYIDNHAPQGKHVWYAARCRHTDGRESGNSGLRSAVVPWRTPPVAPGANLFRRDSDVMIDVRKTFSPDVTAVALLLKDSSGTAYRVASWRPLEVPEKVHIPTTETLQAGLCVSSTAGERCDKPVSIRGYQWPPEARISLVQDSKTGRLYLYWNGPVFVLRESNLTAEVSDGIYAWQTAGSAGIGPDGSLTLRGIKRGQYIRIRMKSSGQTLYSQAVQLVAPLS